MKETIAIAGATGHLGGLVVNALLAQGAEVRALVRNNAASDKTAKLEQSGVKIAPVDMTNVSEMARACEGAACLVSTLQGLQDVIVDLQSRLLDAAIAAGVSRFIPSDYAVDFTRFPEGLNRNLDLRRKFHASLDKAYISATSILNGVFSYILTNMPVILDPKARRVTYWENADQKIDFTTLENTAEFTAHAALDSSAPRVLRIAGDEISARELAALAGEITHSAFELVSAGSLEELAALAKRDRAADPASEEQVFPKWQADQYLYAMFSGLGKLEPLDNTRYPGMAWTKMRDVLANSMNAPQTDANPTR